MTEVILSILLLTLRVSVKKVPFRIFELITAILVLKSILLIHIHIVEVAAHVVVEAILGIPITDTNPFATATATTHAVVVVGFAIVVDFGRVFVVDTDDFFHFAFETIALGPAGGCDFANFKTCDLASFCEVSCGGERGGGGEE